ncbi:Protein phosphatase PP2A regulatory subunit B [Elsinoe fawcettii]|nr:Protein phosphatase PP2A regulatory subunit B [Elsinoe fawcettii]
MPELSGIKCTVELGANNQVLDEFHTTYGNQRVGCYLCVPDNDQPFSIHVTTTSFVHTGIAVFAFMDGQYQANRNKTGIPSTIAGTDVDRKGQVDIRLRQKEEADASGKFIIGREWRFSTLKTAPDGDNIPHLDPSLVANLGTIEVLVLRCVASGSLHPKSATDIGPYTQTEAEQQHKQMPSVPMTHKKTEKAKKKRKEKKVVPKPATVKTVTPAPGENGGFGDFGGLFDGAGDGAWGAPAVDSKQGSAANQSEKGHTNSIVGWQPGAGVDQTCEDYLKSKAEKKHSSRKAPVVDAEYVQQPILQTNKGYWRDWNPQSRGYGNATHGDNAGTDVPEKRQEPRDPYVVPAYEQPQIHGDFAKSKKLSVQATTYKGAKYLHPRARPHYIDSMDVPFAVFTFHYRTRAFFERTKEKSRIQSIPKPSMKSRSALSNRTPDVQQTVRNWNDGNQHGVNSPPSVHNGRRSRATIHSPSSHTKRATTVAGSQCAGYGNAASGGDWGNQQNNGRSQSTAGAANNVWGTPAADATGNNNEGADAAWNNDQGAPAAWGDALETKGTWKTSQKVTDIISTVEFDQTGNYLATGDKGGRVVLFERNESKKTCEYKFHTEFQSHEPEFDYLKSLEIEEKINKIKWCRRQNASHYLLSTNDKTIKLWKVFEKSLKVVAENNLSQELTPAGVGNANGGGPVRTPNHAFRSVSDLKFPRMTHHDTVIAAVPRKVYANAHAYHINSISPNSDGETFISSDDLRINLWNLNIQDQSFNIVDIKPANMEELTEVITAAEFHPQSCNIFMYASSKGTIKLADMRESALCDSHAKQFEQEEDPSSRSFFSEIISSISDVRFSNDGRYILSRDYLTVKIWDVKMDSRPVKTIPIHEHLRPRLCDTYENDSIFDKFEVVFSGDGKNVMTGSYNNNFMIYPSEEGKDTEVVLQADKSAFKAKKVGVPTPMNSATSPGGKDKKGSRANSPAGQGARMRKETDADQIDFNKKILHMSWHPFEDSIAIAATNNLFVFSAL